MHSDSKHIGLPDLLLRAQATEARAVKKLADYMQQPGMRADTLDTLRRSVASARSKLMEIQTKLKHSAPQAP